MQIVDWMAERYDLAHLAYHTESVAQRFAGVLASLGPGTRRGA